MADLRDSTRKGKPGDHLTLYGHISIDETLNIGGPRFTYERLHHGEEDHTSDGVAQEDGQGTRTSKSLADTDEKTGSNGTSKRDKLHMTGFETVWKPMSTMGRHGW